ncbi:hypothetical protein A1Q2_03633 [Trichosporon asahii var. asahii CBS 8904]|uniref:NAD(P)-binding protein n=2 Tax=Trichosporon asahii var. asahii TaxID=189963 RepID=K1VN55_TRIAC|nr:hypothetical protein A1Q1_05224 [Trichosporon asahii var. asahii CBS 2479]EJT53261.1 hypothetical protein A1Q1_05224 [Trichosporon asahii var. asahii CBS 2479]EKD02081.1 hypothetical protein A1Q2_03633 [Trichosporon asahii var. asahii CBS 8904]
MPAVPTSECYAHADRLRGRVVLITGAGSGFGRATALKFTELGAKVVLGDVDAAGLAETVKQVSAQSGPSSVVSAKCDVTSWDDQVALFETGAKAFGNIDVVLPNAGVSEIGRFDPRLDGDASKLTKPNMKTIDIDLIGVLYTTRIALWYFINDKRADPGLRSIVFTGSMSTFYGSDGVGYGVAKAGILGIMKGIVASCNDLKVRVATVCPYFSKTNILDPSFVHPYPALGYAQVSDVVNAFVAAITDPSPKTNYAAYLIPDQWGVFRMAATGQFVGAEAARRSKEETAAFIKADKEKAKAKL